MTDLNELERLLREATAGPWFVYVHTGDGTTIEPGDDWTVYGKHREPVVHEGGFTVHAAANAALIAALRNHAEELIRDARRWRYFRDQFDLRREALTDAQLLAIGDAWDVVLSGERDQIDAMIDAAIAQEQK